MADPVSSPLSSDSRALARLALAIAVSFLVAGCANPGGRGDLTPGPSNTTPLPEIIFEGGPQENGSFVRFRADFDPLEWHTALKGGAFTISYSATFPNGHPGGFLWVAPMFAHLSNPKDSAAPKEKRISGHGFMAWVPAGTQTLTARVGTAPSEDALEKYSNGTVYFYMGGTLAYQASIKVDLPVLAKEQSAETAPVELFRGSDPVESTNQRGDTHASSVSGSAPSARTLLYGMLVTRLSGVQENVTRQSGDLYLVTATNCSAPHTSGASGLPRRDYVLQPPAGPGQAYVVYRGGACDNPVPVGNFRLDLNYRAFQDARPIAIAVPFDVLRPSM